MYELAFSVASRKQLRNLPAQEQLRIRRKLDALAQNPFDDAFDVKKMRGMEEHYRLRVGLYRVVYRINNGQLQIEVIRIGHRKDVYH